MKVQIELSLKANGKRIPLGSVHMDIMLKESAELLTNIPVTKREDEVRELLVRGLQNKEIGTALKMSTRTVKFHASKLYRKYGVLGKHELAMKLLSIPQAIA